MSLSLAVAIAAAAACGGWAAGWLTRGAALAATAIGIAVLAGAGVGGLVLLGTFFVSGSLLTGHAGGGARRRALQVLANGAAAAAGGLAIALDATIGWALLAGGLAAAQADTWATEVGRRSRRPPRLITTGRSVATGTSGAISLLGTLGGAAGAATMALLAWAVAAPVPAAWTGMAGVAGMLADSLLGATVQARYRCPACGRTVEFRRHCDADTGHAGGVRWMTNDTVNALGTGVGAALATLATVAGR